MPPIETEQRSKLNVPNANLTRHEMSLVLRLAAIHPRAGSPLEGFDSGLSADQSVGIDRLREMGLLDGSDNLQDTWRVALTTLASPSHRIHLFLGGSDQWGVMNYYIAQSVVVFHVEANNSHFVALLSGSADILEVCREWMQWANIPDPDPFTADLSEGELAVVAACADGRQQELLQAVVERRAAIPDRLTREQLAYQIEQGLERRDCRWFGGILAVNAPTRFRPHPNYLPAGLEALSRRGWVRLTDNIVAIESPLKRICHELTNTNPYIVLGTGPADGIGSFLLAMRGLNGFWAIHFGAGDSEPARLHNMGGKFLEAVVQLQLASAFPAPNTESSKSYEKELSGITCSQCGALNPPNKKYCGDCANRLTSDAVVPPIAALATGTQAVPNPPASLGEGLTVRKWFRLLHPNESGGALATLDLNDIRALAAALRRARDEKVVPEEKFKDLHRAFRVKGPNDTIWTVGLGTLRWSKLVNGKWEPADAPEFAYLDADLLRELMALTNQSGARS